MPCGGGAPEARRVPERIAELAAAGRGAARVGAAGVGAALRDAAPRSAVAVAGANRERAQGASGDAADLGGWTAQAAASHGRDPAHGVRVRAVVRGAAGARAARVAGAAELRRVEAEVGDGAVRVVGAERSHHGGDAEASPALLAGEARGRAHLGLVGAAHVAQLAVDHGFAAGRHPEEQRRQAAPAAEQPEAKQPEAPHQKLTPKAWGTTATRAPTAGRGDARRGVVM